MKPRAVLKLVADIFMTIALLFLMGYQFWGEAPHEWVGVGMFVLFILHHVLNASWHKTLFKGKFSAPRIFTLCIDVLVLVSMLAQIYSGIVMSRYVFSFLPSGGMALARRLHILGAYWGFLLMSLHLGLHWNMILGIARKAVRMKGRSKIRSITSFVIALVIAGYGVQALIGRDFVTYLFLRSEFVFLDYSESKIFFYMDYLALMGLCIFVAHYSVKLIQKCKKKTEVQE